MIRFVVIVLAALGASYALGRAYPPAAAVAFTALGFGFTYIMLVAAGAGVVAYKVTK
jgi:hypothetical protein